MTSHSSSQPIFYDEWRTFVETRQLPQWPLPIVRSWQRCQPRLNPMQAPNWMRLSPDIFAKLRHQHDNLLRLARPIFEDLHEYAESLPMAILLSDSTNCVLEIMGDIHVVTWLKALGIHPGVFLSEGSVGTNAAAVALLEGMPVGITGAQHYLRAFHGLYSVGAPLFTLTGSPLGAIMIASTADRASPLLLALVNSSAHLLEHRFHNEKLLDSINRRVNELNITLDAINEAVVEWDANGIVTRLNSRACHLLGLELEHALGRPLAMSLKSPNPLKEAIERGTDLQDVEMVFTLGAHDATQDYAFVVSLRITPPSDENVQTYILTLRPIEQVRQLVTRLVGAQARLSLDDVIGHSSSIRRLRHEALASARASAPVLLMGAAGTGKNVLARAIHNSSSRANGPFLTVNCRAIPRELALGELLGYEAVHHVNPDGQPSKFELANGGTLYLDEIDALTLEAQAALLHVIESDEVIRLGGTRVISVDVRLIASTSHDLQSMVAQSAFRSDLYFRLSAFSLHMPSLHERPQDIPLIIDHTLRQIGQRLKSKPSLSPEAAWVLQAYPWPGNVRELEAVLERAAAISQGDVIEMIHLPPHIRENRVLMSGTPLTEPVHNLQEAEHLAILRAGRAANGNMTQMARLLGIGRTTLWRRMKALGIDKEDFQELRR